MMTPQEKLEFARWWWSRQQCPGCLNPLSRRLMATAHHRVTGVSATGGPSPDAVCPVSRDDLYTMQLLAEGVVSVPA